MNKLLLLVFCASFTFLHAKVVTLTAEVTYTNNSKENIPKIFHRVTIPSERHYQKVQSVSIWGTNQYKVKHHKSDSSQKFVELMFALPPLSSKKMTISFEIEITNMKYNIDEVLGYRHDLKKFTFPSKRIESSSSEFTNMALNIMGEKKITSELVIKAYQYPSKLLKYKVQKRTSALTALRTKQGDCTEYAMVFVALCRAMDIPSRVVNLFNFRHKNTFSQPNHNEAEVFIKNLGWVPIYSNLGLGSLEGEYSPGNISNTNILYSHGVWTWSNYLPNTKHLKGLIEQKMFWKVK